MDPFKPTFLERDAGITRDVDCRPPGQSVGRWKQLNIVEATHLPFVQVLTGFTRPERGIIDQRIPVMTGTAAFAAVLFCFQAESKTKNGIEFVNKLEILRLFSLLTLERRKELRYNAEIRAQPGTS